MTRNSSTSASVPAVQDHRGRGGLRIGDGASIVDLLLSAVNPHDRHLVNAILDLRNLAAEGSDATACLEQLFRVRRLLRGRHQAAFYSVDAWARHSLHVEVRADRGAPWLAFEIPADSIRTEQIANAALAQVARGEDIPSTAQVRFVFSGC